MPRFLARAVLLALVTTLVCPAWAAAAPRGSSANQVWYQGNWSGGPGQVKWSDTTRYNKRNSDNVLCDPAGRLTFKASGSPPNYWLKTGELGSAPNRDVIQMADKAYLMGGCELTEVRDIKGTSPSNIIALSESTNGGFPRALRFDGASWSISALSGPITGAPDYDYDAFSQARASALLLPGAGQAYAACCDGKDATSVVLARSGGGWSKVLEVPGPGFSCIAGSSPGDVWASGPDPTGAQNLLFHFDGTAWSRFTGDVGASRGFCQLVATSPAEVYGYDNGELRRYDGASWSLIATDGVGFTDLAASAQGALYALKESDDTVFRLDGASWTALPVAWPGAQVRLGALAPRDDTIAAIGHVRGSPQDMNALCATWAGAGWVCGPSGVKTASPSCAWFDSSSTCWFGEAADPGDIVQVAGSIYLWGVYQPCSPSHDAGGDTNHSCDPATGSMDRLAETPVKSRWNEYVKVAQGTAAGIYAAGPVLGDSSAVDPFDRVYMLGPQGSSWTERSRGDYSLASPRGPAQGRRRVAEGSRIHTIGAQMMAYRDGSGQTRIPENLVDVAAADQTHAWAMGEGTEHTSIWFYDGARWSRQYSRSFNTASGGICALGPAQAWALDGAHMLCYDGAAWSLAHDFSPQLAP